jgi:signal transduction histidine kinase
MAENEKKINHHGLRADGIVKGMLLHSRSGSGRKEPTNINSMADEYLRLAYHGLRAKDKSFNADFRIEPDENLPQVKVVSQDVGRVLLNLINNAFFTVYDRSKEGEEGYRPEVVVSTKAVGEQVEIRVKDNGKGIPEEIKDKIFQPFFTTKPTGEGTGLGLSLSYDIITKGHGGSVEVKSELGTGTELIIILPQ